MQFRWGLDLTDDLYKWKKDLEESDDWKHSLAEDRFKFDQVMKNALGIRGEPASGNDSLNW